MNKIIVRDFDEIKWYIDENNWNGNSVIYSDKEKSIHIKNSTIYITVSDPYDLFEICQILNIEHEKILQISDCFFERRKGIRAILELKEKEDYTVINKTLCDMFEMREGLCFIEFIERLHEYEIINSKVGVICKLKKNPTL